MTENKNQSTNVEAPKTTMKETFLDYKLHLTVMGVAVIAELIGKQNIKITDTISLVFLPLVYAIILGLIVYLIKPFKFVKITQSIHAETTMLLCFSPFLAKMAISSGQSIERIISAGPALLLQEFGNLATIFVALPFALLLGFKRESIGLTHSIGREQNVGLIVDKYGFGSAETRGVMMIYIIGTMVGAIFIGGLASFLATVTPISPLAYAMATGVGSGSMTAAAVGSLIATFPEMEKDILAFSSMSNILTQCTGIYMSIFIGLPLTNKLYDFLEPIFGRVKKATRKNKNDEISKNEEEV